MHNKSWIYREFERLSDEKLLANANSSFPEYRRAYGDAISDAKVILRSIIHKPAVQEREITRESVILMNCTLEWHKHDGVLYVHDNSTGVSVLRLNNLPTDLVRNCVLSPGQLIDARVDPDKTSIPVTI